MLIGRIKKNSFVRVTMQNQQILAGQLVACDEVMNVLLENTVEFKWNQRTRNWQKRQLGLCIIRGSSVSSISLRGKAD
jgi:small nuclear ribonucleoprotein (snRNP)-like protein